MGQRQLLPVAGGGGRQACGVLPVTFALGGLGDALSSLCLGLPVVGKDNAHSVVGRIEYSNTENFVNCFL